MTDLQQQQDNPQDNPYAPGKARKDTLVVVAMSGGVDSSTVAAHLAHQGYRVIGITLQLYDHGAAIEKKGACCAGQDIHDAKRVAESIGIPHYVLDYESIFRESVMDEFADSYLRGETPIPCVRCNQSVKFRDLFKVAKDLNADALATGHYIQRHQGATGPELHRAADSGKDQSYFLFATTKKQLDYIHFPLGEYTKAETRKLAESYQLLVCDKPDSQDICFVPNGNYASVIEKLRPGALDKGKILHENGTELGEHEGIINFTIGQRKGIGIAWHEPLYVLRINPALNQVIVGPESSLFSEEVLVADINWLGDGDYIPAEGLEVTVKLRSTHQGAKAKLLPHPSNGTQAIVTLYEGARGVTPGQACVFYQDSRVLGGGWIRRKEASGLASHQAA